jgi:hypothetical protein
MNGASINGNDEFSDAIDLTSYAGGGDDGMNGGLGANYLSNGNGLDGSGVLANNYLHNAYVASPSPTPSPMAHYSQHNIYGGPIKPFGSSTLALQGQLIEQERARREQAAAATSRAYLQHPTTSASASIGFNPHAFQSHPPQQTPALAISPSALSAPVPAPVASTSTGAAKAVKKAAPTGRSASPATSTSSTAKRSRTASPPANSYDSEQWRTFHESKLKQHLNSKRITGAALSTAQFLVKNLALFSHTEKTSILSPWGDASDVPPDGRAEVLSTLLKYAKDDFWKAWLDVGASSSSSGGKGKEKETNGGGKAKSEGLELFQRWLDGAAKGYVSSKEDKDKDKSSDKGREKKRKEMEQTTLALVLQVRFPLHSLCLPALRSPSLWDELSTSESTKAHRRRNGKSRCSPAYEGDAARPKREDFAFRALLPSLSLVATKRTERNG